jgi:hypothetical protein
MLCLFEFPHKGSSFTDVRHDLGRVFGNLVKVLSGNGRWVKEGSDESDRGGSHSQKVSRIVQVNARSRVDGQKGKSRAHGLDPTGSTGNARKELLQRGAKGVGIEQLGGSLAAGDDDNVALLAPLDNGRYHDRSNDEFTSGVDGRRGVFGCENGSASNHHITVVLFAEVGEVVQAVGSGESELTDLETSIDGSVHGLGAVVRSSSTEDGACADVGKLLKDCFVALDCLHAVETGSRELASGNSSAAKGRGSNSEGHGEGSE